MKKSVLKVKFCNRNSTDCSPTNKASSGVFKLPKNSTDEEVGLKSCCDDVTSAVVLLV